MEVDEIHSLAHQHLNTSERQELASWLMMESSMQPADDEYYEALAKEQEAREAEIAQWDAGFSVLRRVVKKNNR